jgi:hypothetical protein
MSEHAGGRDLHAAFHRRQILPRRGHDSEVMGSVELHGHLLPTFSSLALEVEVVQGRVRPGAILLEDDCDVDVLDVLVTMRDFHETQGLADGPVTAAALLAAALFRVPLPLEVVPEFGGDVLDGGGAVPAQQEVRLPQLMGVLDLYHAPLVVLGLGGAVDLLVERGRGVEYVLQQGHHGRIVILEHGQGPREIRLLLRTQAHASQRGGGREGSIVSLLWMWSSEEVERLLSSSSEEEEED